MTEEASLLLRGLIFLFRIENAYLPDWKNRIGTREPNMLNGKHVYDSFSFTAQKIDLQIVYFAFKRSLTELMKNIVKLNVNFFSLAYILRRIEKKTRRNNIEIRKIQFYMKTYHRYGGFKVDNIGKNFRNKLILTRKS